MEVLSKATRTVRRYLYALLDLILPRRCACCGGKLLLGERHLCLDCTLNMPLTYFWTQKFNPMADKFNARIQDGLKKAEPYSFAAALFFYKGGWQNLTKAVKYKADLSLGKYLGSAMAAKLNGSELFRDVDTVIPVPLHRRRYLKRGYNQAEIIARAIAEGLNVKDPGKDPVKDPGDGTPAGAMLDTASLYRSRNTISQATLDVSEKAENVAGAFAVRENAFESLPAHILLVDDVFTTGSTLCECQRALRQALVRRHGNAGAKVRISAVTLAYVGD